MKNMHLLSTDIVACSVWFKGADAHSRRAHERRESMCPEMSFPYASPRHCPVRRWRQIAASDHSISRSARSSSSFGMLSPRVLAAYPATSGTRRGKTRAGGRTAAAARRIILQLLLTQIRVSCGLTAYGIARSDSQRGSSEDPIRNSSTARAHCLPSRIAQTTSDWPRRMSPAANTLGAEVA